MNLQGFKSAEHLAKLSRAKVAAMMSTADLTEVLDLYEAFVQDSNKFFNRLHQASDDGKSKAWCGRIKNQRKKDDLLQYVKQSRHVDAHGGGPLGIEQRERIEVKVAAGGHMSALLWEPGEQVQFGDGDNGCSGRVLKPGVSPQAVFNKGKLYQRPSSHLGQPIHVSTVAEIAQLAQTYMEGTLAEARAKFIDQL